MKRSGTAAPPTEFSGLQTHSYMGVPHLPFSSSHIGKAIWFGFGLFVITYGLFQKKLLPKPVTKVVSKILFMPTLPITMLMRWGNLWTTIDEALILGVAPVGFLGHADKLHKQGVRGVVNMCSEYGGPSAYYDNLGIKQLRLPTVDHFEPSVEHMKEACRFIKYYKDRGEKVYVHCKAGHGRAASIALCWMMHENPNVSSADLNKLLSSKRKVRPTLYKQKHVRLFQESISNNKDGSSCASEVAADAPASSSKKE